MIDYKEVAFDRISIHSVGNHIKNEDLILTDSPVQIHEGKLKNLLLKYFFSHFKEPEFFAFDDNEGSFEQNKMFW